MPTKYKLVYLRPAAEDFQEIVKFHIQEVGVNSARKIYTAMRNTIQKLSDFPLMGQVHPDPLLAASNYRKLVLTRTYVAIYSIRWREKPSIFIASSTAPPTIQDC